MIGSVHAKVQNNKRKTKRNGTFLLTSSQKKRLQELSRQAVLALCHLFGSAGNDQLAATVSTVGAEVDDPVGTLDDFQVMLDDEDGMAALDECFERTHQTLDVVEVQARGGLVEDKECGLLLLLSDEVG